MKYVAGLLFAISSSAIASDAYQFELQTGTTHYEGDNSDYSFPVIGRYYFRPVKSIGVPLAEAAFLGKNDVLSVSYVRDEEDDFESEFFGALTRLHFAGQWTAELGVSYSTDQFEDFYESDVQALTAAVGYFFADNQEIKLQAEHANIEGKVSGFAGDYSFDESEDFWSLHYKTVQHLSGTQAVNLETSLERLDDWDEAALSLASDYYFNPFFSLGGSFVLANGEGQGWRDTHYGINARYFANSAFSIQLNASHTPSFDNSYGIDLTLRF